MESACLVRQIKPHQKLLCKYGAAPLLSNADIKQKTMNDKSTKFNLDTPLQTASALDDDKLSRRGFAESAANALLKIPATAGLAVSIEGPWGSGKTSVLAMIEAVLRKDSMKSPVIVHFNPWLIGDKDALLRHFLSRIAEAVKLNDHSSDGKKVAKQIKAYSKAFDVVKLIPGAEPWVSLVKSVIDSVGDTAGSIAEYKTPDLEVYKQKVEDALRKFPRPIVVFVDDIDRLFPAEVFEMVRIIKAVGGLPNVGYVLAWDAAYVSSALDKLDVPFADSYLDKVVQIRMPLPSLSVSARGKMINEALDGLDPEALTPRFKDHDEHLSSLYFSGLRDLLEQPRDVARVFNALRVTEPQLRGEISFADILGMAALSVKAPDLFVLLRKNPRIFVGKLASDGGFPGQVEDVIKEGCAQRNIAYEASSSPINVRNVVHFLFPFVAEAEDSYALYRASDVEGRVGHPDRLAIALQLSLSSSDVSLEAAKKYLRQPTVRTEIAEGLARENCTEFLELLGDVANSLKGDGICDLAELCEAIAALPKQAVFVERATVGRQSLQLNPNDVALRAVYMLVHASNDGQMTEIAERIATNPETLSCAAEIVSQSYVPDREQYSRQLTLSAASKADVLKTFARNISDACEDGTLFTMANPGFILWTLARLCPEVCPDVYKALKTAESSLDKFALSFLQRTWSSSEGQTYGLPRDESLQSVYCSLDEFKTHAEERLLDTRLTNPTKAAWRCVVMGKELYGSDGSEVRR